MSDQTTSLESNTKNPKIRAYVVSSGLVVAAVELALAWWALSAKQEGVLFDPLDIRPEFGEGL